MWQTYILHLLNLPVFAESILSDFFIIVAVIFLCLFYLFILIVMLVVIIGVFFVLCVMFCRWVDRYCKEYIVHLLGLFALTEANLEWVFSSIAVACVCSLQAGVVLGLVATFCVTHFRVMVLLTENKAYHE